MKWNTCNLLSSLYGQLIVVITAILMLTEVMENPMPLLSFHVRHLDFELSMINRGALTLGDSLDQIVKQVSSQFQGYLYAYLIGGSCLFLLFIYISSILDKCPSFSSPSSSNSSSSPSLSDVETATYRGTTCGVGTRKLHKCPVEVSCYLRIGLLGSFLIPTSTLTTYRLRRSF